MNLRSNSSIKEKQLRRVKETNLVSGSLIFVGVVGILGATTPFWHIFFDADSEKPFNGFENFHVFVYQFGIQFSPLVCAAFIFWIKQFVSEDFKGIRRIINLVGGSFIFTSTYFLMWVIWAQGDFPEEWYYITMGIVSILISLAVYYLAAFSKSLMLRYRLGLKLAVEWIMEVRNRVVPQFAFLAHDYKRQVPDKAFREEKEAQLRQELLAFERENDKVLEDIARTL